MSSLPTTLAALARGGGQLLRIPTAVLLVWSGGTVVLLAALVAALLVPAGGPGPVGSAVLIALVALLALPVVVLAVRRRRWLQRSAAAVEAGERPEVVVTTELVTIDTLGDRVEDQMTGLDGEEDVRAVVDAFTELRLPTTERRGAGARLTRTFGVGRLAVIGRVLGRTERAQRALLTAAGGPTRAPYLVDDLRVTVLALVTSVVSGVVGGLGALVLAAVLLTR